MLWQKVDQRWNSRLDKGREGDVSWKVELWPVPGESPLEVRVCTRDGVPVTKFANAKEAPRTSITLHLTCGYGNFTGLMGGSDHGGSAHILLGRCGTTYLLVPTGFTSWHATWWNPSSIGIEIDNIGGLRKQGDWMVSEYSLKDTYCKADEKEVFLEKQFAGYKYWATLTEKQYAGLGKLLKALCLKHKIPRIILPEEHRYDDFKKDEKIRRDFRGICTHVNIDPARRSDIGPYIDWPKVIQYGGLTEADCYHPPASVLDTWQNATGGSPVTGSGSASSSSSNAGGSGDARPAATKPSSDTPPTKPKPAVGAETLPAPVLVDSHTLRVHIGSHGGRLCLSVKQPGDPLPTTPDAKSAPAAKAPGKRDEFIAACMNFLGAPYKAGSGKPAEGIDGAHLIGLALRRVGVFKNDDEMPEDATHLSALWHVSGADPSSPTDEIVPGDLAWFGKGDHDNDPMQHPMVYLGGGRVLGPVPDGAASSAVQAIAVDKVPEKFAGWMHIDDFGDDPPKHGDHPGDKPLPGEKLTSALLPPTPAGQYDALKAVVARTGGKWEDAKGKVNLVGVKSLDDRCLVSPRPGGWNDTLFAVFLDEDGHKCVLELRASLNPGTDENPTETWQLWEGSWKFKLVQGDSTEGKALQPDGKVKGWFDGAGMGAPRPIDHEQEASAKDLQPAKPPQEEGKDKPPAAKPKPTPKDDKPAPPADKPFVFDGKSKKLSMKFGMRMMRALLEWELHEEGGQLAGVTYSHNGDCPKYKAPEGVVTEWPALDGLVRIKPPKQTAAGVSLWMAFGVQWGASGSTNCCNAQMAAIFVALQDGNMRIQKDGELLEVDVTKGTPHASAIKDRPPDGKNPVGYSTVFESVWVQAGKSKYLDSKGKKLFGGYEYIAPAWAMKWLGVGDAVGKWGEEAAPLKVRMGDNACWSSHNWLVGDIRYAVTLKGRKTPVYVDQSDFVRGDHPDPNAQDRERSGYKMTREDCLWVEQNEALFEARLQAFLDGKQMEFDGKDYEVTKIEAHAVRVFSSNCVSFTTREKQPRTFKTASGVVYEHKTSPPGTDEWVRDDERTKNNRLGLGVSRPWSKFADHVDKANGNCWGFARWFDNAGGAEWKDQGHG